MLVLNVLSIDSQAESNRMNAFDCFCFSLVNAAECFVDDLTNHRIVNADCGFLPQKSAIRIPDSHEVERLVAVIDL